MNSFIYKTNFIRVQTLIELGFDNEEIIFNPYTADVKAFGLSIKEYSGKIRKYNRDQFTS